MPLNVTQVSECIDICSTNLDAQIRNGNLKAVKVGKQGRYQIQTEDLIDFFARNPQYWHRFLKNCTQPRYKTFRSIILNKMAKYTGRRGPLYYVPIELSYLLGVERSVPTSWIRNGVLSAIKTSERRYYISEQSLVDFLNRKPKYIRALKGYEPTNSWLRYLRDRLLFLYEGDEDI